jgi:hypothetical protein
MTQQEFFERYTFNTETDQLGERNNLRLNEYQKINPNLPLLMKNILHL